MIKYPKLIDKKRKHLADTLREIAPEFHVLRIATGYWDLPGTLEIINELKDYTKICLLIGKEPLSHHLQKKFRKLFVNEDIFKDIYISSYFDIYYISIKIDK